jgi:hypothetical protein
MQAGNNTTLVLESQVATYPKKPLYKNGTEFTKSTEHNGMIRTKLVTDVTNRLMKHKPKPKPNPHWVWFQI